MIRNGKNRELHMGNMKEPIMLLLFIVGILIALLPVIVEKRKMFHTGIPIDAQVHELSVKHIAGRRRTYIIWRYEYADKEYFHHSRKGTAKEDRKIGHKRALMISIYDLSKVYEFMTARKKNMLIGTGIIITIISVIGFFV